MPGASVPTGVSIGARRDGHLVARPLLAVEREAEAGREHVDRLLEAGAEDAEHRALRGHLGRLPEEHDVAHDVLGAVGADVGELLGAHVAHAARERRDHEREALGDAARVDARAVQRDAGRAARGLELRRAGARAREEPAERRDHVLARREEAPHLLGVREERRVDDAVGVEREERLDVARRARRRVGRARRARPTSRPALSGAVHEDADELELGVGEDPLDRRAADVAGRPLDHAVHGESPTPAGGAAILGEAARPGKRYSQAPGGPMSSACEPVRADGARETPPPASCWRWRWRWRSRRAGARGGGRDGRAAGTRRCRTAPYRKTIRAVRATARRAERAAREHDDLEERESVPARRSPRPEAAIRRLPRRSPRSRGARAPAGSDAPEGRLGAGRHPGPLKLRRLPGDAPPAGRAPPRAPLRRRRRPHVRRAGAPRRRPRLQACAARRVPARAGQVARARAPRDRGTTRRAGRSGLGAVRAEAERAHVDFAAESCP